MKMRVLTLSLCCVMLCVTPLAGAVIIDPNDWPMFHHDSQHTGYSSSIAPISPTLMWNATIGPIFSSSPSFGKGRLYIGSEDGHLYIFDADPSEGTPEGIPDPPGSTADLILLCTVGGAIRSTPAYYDGKIYFGSLDGKVYTMYSSIGTEIGNYSTGGPVESSPTIYDDKVFIGSDDGKLYCLDARNTSIHIWGFPTGSPVRSSPAVSDGKVCVGSDNGKIYCLHASNGTEIWNYTTGGIVRSSPTIVDGRVYVGSLDNNVYCLYASNGTKVWNHLTGDAVLSSPAVYEKKVYIGSDDGKIYCLYASNGTEFWNFSTGGTVRSSPAVAEGKIYVGSFDGFFYCLNATNGVQIWHHNTGAPVNSSPAVLNMRAYVASENGGIFCFRDHNPPNIPDAPSGTTVGILGETYRFISRTSDHENDPIYFMFEWGDGKQTSWLGPFENKEVVNATHSWAAEGDYQIKVKAKDSYGFESDWSQPAMIQINILTIGMLRGGFGIHMEIKNVGERKIWFITWNISWVGGRIINPAIGKVGGSIESIPSGESEQVATGPFFELGRLKVTVTIQDKFKENILTKTVSAFAFGYLVFLLPW